MAHKGKRQYSGGEVANINLGQGGFIWTENPTGHNDKFIAGEGNDADPIWYYPDVEFWSGIKCYPTVDSSTGTTIATVVLTPLEDDLIDQSAADNPGSDIEIKLQSGQSIFGAFKSIEVTSVTNGTLIIYKG